MRNKVPARSKRHICLGTALLLHVSVVHSYYSCCPGFVVWDCVGEGSEVRKFLGSCHRLDWLILLLVLPRWCAWCLSNGICSVLPEPSYVHVFLTGLGTPCSTAAIGSSSRQETSRATSADPLSLNVSLPSKVCQELTSYSRFSLVILTLKYLRCDPYQLGVSGLGVWLSMSRLQGPWFFCRALGFVPWRCIWASTAPPRA